jgi:hypothetical protein
MLRAAASLLLLALPLAGCSGPASPEKPQEETPPMKASSAPAPAQEVSRAPSAEEQKEQPDSSPFLPAKAVLQKSGGQSTVWELQFSSPQPVNFVLLPEGTNAAAAVVQNGEKQLYRSSPDSDSRLLRFDTEQAERLTLLLESPQNTKEEPRAGLLSGETALFAYLPASTSPEILESYAASFKRLKQVTVITGLCWDENGQVTVIDENYPALMEKLCALREQFGFSVSSTLYPARSLIQEGRAGEVTEKNREALQASILSHAREYRLNGIDLDWETPRDAAEWESCCALIAGLGALKEEAGLSISAALYPENTGRLSLEAMAALDRLQLMSYDQFDPFGRHASFEGMAADIRQALQAGWESEQLMVGIPAYGRPLDGAARWPLYCDQPLPLETNLLEGSYFNNLQMVRDKAAFCQLSGLGGAFLFHLTGDLPAENPHSLLGAID